MTTGWIRLSRTCDNRCVFCVDADVLDGTIVGLDEVRADIDAAAEGGATRVVLSGGEPTLSKHLLAAIKHAKSRDLYVALATHGRVIKTEKIARMLEAAGLDEVAVSVHSGRRSTHDALAGNDQAWVESLAGLRHAGRTGMRVTLRAVLVQQNKDELAHLMHLAMMGGAKGMELRRLTELGGGARHRADLQVSTRSACAVLAELWFEAKEEVVDFSASGFDDTLDEGVDPPASPVRQADRAALRLLRQRAALFPAAGGFSLLGVDDTLKDVVALADAEGGLAQAGLELAARAAPFVDAPWCVGGRPDDPQRWGPDALYGPACDACPARARCPGLPGKAKKLDPAALAPLPHWRGVHSGAALVCGGGSDAILTDLTLPALAVALRAEGLDATWDPEPTRFDAELVVCGDADTAARALAARRPGQRVIVFDGALGLGLDRLPAPADVVESAAPGRVDLIRAAGVDLRTVRFRPYPVPPAATDAAPAPSGPIVAVGEAADWSLLEAALVHAAGRLPEVHAYGPAHVPDSGVWTRHVDAPDAEILAAVLGARLVVLATGRGTDAASRRRLARDLRWLSVAGAAGRPVVALRAPAADDHVRHDVTGWMATAPGVAGLSEGLRRLTGDPSRYERHAAEARALGQLASVTTWARDLAHGRQPDAAPPRSDAQRRFPPW